MRKDEVKKIKLYTTIACLVNVLLICFFSYLHYRKYHYIDKGELVAKINNFKIYKNDIQSRLDFLAEKNGINNLKMKDLKPEVLKAVLMEVYTDDLILKLAKKKKLDRDSEYRLLAKEYYFRLLKDTFISDFVLNTITENEIRDEYNRLVKIIEGKEERKISHILVDSEEEINRIRNLITHRNNFEKLAEQKSIDKASAINGGSIGYVIKEEITIPEFADVAFLLKVGELSKPIRTKEGWHLIRVDDIRDIKIKSYKESRAEILEKLRNEKFAKFIDELLKSKKKSKDDVKVEIIDNDAVKGTFETYTNGDTESIESIENTEANVEDGEKDSGEFEDNEEGESVIKKNSRKINQSKINEGNNLAFIKN